MRSPQPEAIRSLANRIAAALRPGGYGPARAALSRYREAISIAWGVDPDAVPRRLAARPRAGRHDHCPDPLTGSGPAARLYCAELCALLTNLSSLTAAQRPGAGGDGADGPPSLRLCGSGAGSSVLSTPPRLPWPLVDWLCDPPGALRSEVEDDLAALGANDLRRTDPFFDSAQQVLRELLPERFRHDLGIHPTPGWMARLVLDHIQGPLDAAARPRPDPIARAGGLVMDPACGTGPFLLEVLRSRARVCSERGTAATSICEGVMGVEASPLLAATAQVGLRAALCWSLGDQAPGGYGPPVLQADVLCDLTGGPERGSSLGTGDGRLSLPRFDLVVGNPPWVAWDALPAGYKAKLAAGPLQDLNAFEAVGFEARLGKANDDVSLLFVLVAMTHILAQDGRVAFLTKLNLVTNESSRAIRRFGVHMRRSTRDDAARAPDVSFAMIHLADLRRCNPFTAQVEPALLVLQRDRLMAPLLPSSIWTRERADGARIQEGPAYSPVIPQDPRGPWAPCSRDRTDTEELVGALPYTVRHGLKHDCNGVFLLTPRGRDGAGRIRVENRPETSRRIGVSPWSGALEPTFLRPLIQSRHLRPYTLKGWSYALVPATPEGPVPEETLKDHAPATWSYLQRSRDALAKRRSRVFHAPPFYRVFGVGPYNWSPAMVIWCGMGFRPWFVALEAVSDPWLGTVMPVPDASCYLIPTESPGEAHFLAGLLNSDPVRRFLESRSPASKRGLSRAVIARLRLPVYDPLHPEHRDLSRAAAALARVGPECEPPAGSQLLEAESLAARVLGLS